jgi:uncharacterized lipoprotein YbaY
MSPQRSALGHAASGTTPLGSSAGPGCATATSPGENGKAAVAVSPVASDGLHLPPGSSVELTLADITVAEAPPLEVAQVTYRDFPQNAPLPLPLQLALPYNPEKVLAEHTYVVSARVRDAAETLRYLNTQPVYALTRGALNDVQVVVNPVDPP